MVNLVIIVPADVLVPNGAQPSIGTVVNEKVNMYFPCFLVIIDFLSYAMAFQRVNLLWPNDLSQHWSRYWLVACYVPSYQLNQCCLIVNQTLRNNLHSNLNKS